MISQTYKDETVTANVTGSYGPTIVHGAMIYFVDNVFTAFVVANIDQVNEDSNRERRR